MILTCELNACLTPGLAPGRWLPVIVLRAPYQYRNSSPADAVLGVLVCDDCKSKTGLQDFLSDAGWTQISDGLVAHGKIAPERDRTALAWRSIDDPDEMVRVMVARIRLRQAARS